MARTARSVMTAAGLALAAALTAAMPATQREGAQREGDSALAAAFTTVTRSTAWTQVEELQLDFPTHHPQGLAVSGDRVFLSSVEIIEPTVRHPSPVDGYDRTPGRGVGHVFVLDRAGNLLRDITLGEGDVYHPGGIDVDSDGTLWVPVAEYRPDSASIVYGIDVETLEVTERFRVADHVGGIVHDEASRTLAGVSWGSRTLYEWSTRGREREEVANSSHFIDHQDCQYVPSAQMLCGGIAGLPQSPAAAGTGYYELGGLALVDLRDSTVVHEVPLQQWSSAGHVVTRNPVQLTLDGDRLTLWAAPDDEEEVAGTELLRYEAVVPR